MVKYQGFKDRLEAAIRNRRLKKKEFATLVGVTPRALSRYLHSEALPSRFVTMRMAELLGVTTDWLLNGNTSGLAGDRIQDVAAGYGTDGSFKARLAAIADELTDEEERQTVMRCAEALRVGPMEIRAHLINQMKMVEHLLMLAAKETRKKKSR